MCIRTVLLKRVFYNITVCRYYEGQLAPISEVDLENNLATPQVRVTEAAEKVHARNKFDYIIA